MPGVRTITKYKHNYNICFTIVLNLTSSNLSIFYFIYRQQMIAVLQCKVNDNSIHSIQNDNTQTTTQA